MTTRVAPQLIDQTNGIGYTTGVGGTQTQASSKATTVTLNAPCGRITTANDALASGNVVGFICNNSFVNEFDSIAFSHAGGGDPGDYAINIQAGVGAMTVRIRNVSGSSKSDALAINFAVIKGVAS
jgi:hypothetical protein